MNSRAGFACALVLAWLAGCAGAQSSAPVPLPAPVASDASASDAPAPAPSASAPTPAPTAADTTPAAPAPAPLTPICQAKCDKLASKCSKVSIENCRLNCGKYDPPPAGCADQVRVALECARDAKDLTCANVAPESCSSKFKEIAACSSGVATQKSAEPAGLPEGWERVTDSANGFSVALPKGSADKQVGDKTVRTVTAADGTSYTVSVLPVPTEKPSEKSLLHLMMKIQGRCSDKLKLDGFVEKAGRASIHYMSHCPDKTDWNGMLYIGPKNMVMLSAQAPTGKVGVTDPFFYEFEYSEP